MNISVCVNVCVCPPALWKGTLVWPCVCVRMRGRGFEAGGAEQLRTRKAVTKLLVSTARDRSGDQTWWQAGPEHGNAGRGKGVERRIAKSRKSG